MSGRILGMALVMGTLLTLAGCQHVHDPWVNNGKQWKEQRFDTHAPNTELRQRLETGQSDR
ncbi:MAG: hypothetical protein WCC36_03830 [Gammaproteobacteria bacterium]